MCRRIEEIGEGWGGDRTLGCVHLFIMPNLVRACPQAHETAVHHSAAWAAGRKSLAARNPWAGVDHALWERKMRQAPGVNVQSLAAAEAKGHEGKDSDKEHVKYVPLTKVDTEDVKPEWKHGAHNPRDLVHLDDRYEQPTAAALTIDTLGQLASTCFSLTRALFRGTGTFTLGTLSITPSRKRRRRRRIAMMRKRRSMMRRARGSRGSPRPSLSAWHIPRRLAVSGYQEGVSCTCRLGHSHRGSRPGLPLGRHLSRPP